MKIGITCYATYGGSGIVGSELARELVRLGHTVHIIARSLPTRLTELSDDLQFHEVEALNYPLFEAPHYSLALAVKMAEIGCREQLDLLHVHYAIPHSISGRRLVFSLPYSKELEVTISDTANPAPIFLQS